MKLTHSYRVRLSSDDMLLLNELKKLRVKPTTFIRNAIREKIERDLPKIIEAEKKRIAKEWLKVNPDMVFFIENPRGMLRKMPFMQEFKRHTIWYIVTGKQIGRAHV